MDAQTSANNFPEASISGTSGFIILLRPGVFLPANPVPVDGAGNAVQSAKGT